MPARAMRRRPPAPVAVAGAPPVDVIGAALGLLSVFATAPGMKQAKDILSAMEAAAKANTQALEGFGPAGRIADLVEQSEADRAAAARELSEARLHTEAVEREAGERVQAERDQLEAERRQLAEDKAALDAREQSLAEREQAFANETANLRRALAG